MIRRARRDGREARGNEEKEWIRKGATVSSSPHGITSWSSSTKNCFYSSLQNALLKCHGVKQNAKKCAIGEQNVIN